MTLAREINVNGMMEVDARLHYVKEVEALSRAGILRNMALNKRMEKTEARLGNRMLGENSLWVSHISLCLTSKVLVAFAPDCLLKDAYVANSLGR